MAGNCKIYTPDNWVSILLDEVGYKNNLYGKRVLENSCGTGNILRRIVERYIVDSLKKGYSTTEIKNGLARDITGLEIDKKSCVICKRRLSNMAQKYGITGVQWNVIQCNALTFEEHDYSYVIGNPPYITYHDLSVEDREFLRTKFRTCKRGRFDYCYAFIEQSISNLLYRGKLAYIVPNSILKNVWAEDLRAFIHPYLRKIADLKNKNVFEDVMLSPIILVAKKEKRMPSPQIVYQCEDEQLNLVVKSDAISSDPWALGSYTVTSKYKFGDHFEVANSVATLLNEAFLIRDYITIDEQFISTNGKIIERSILRPAVSIKTLNAYPQPLIIFPYSFDESGELLHYNETELEQQFPHALEYLRNYKEELQKRTADKSAQWFEYGRSQAIRHLNCEKLVISTMVSGDIKIAVAGKDAIPYAGLYIIPKGAATLNRAIEILEQEDFKRYAKQHGVPTAHNSYRISKKIVEAYSFDF